MEQLSKETILAIIINEFGFNPDHAQDAYDRLERHPEVFNAFCAWLSNRDTLPELECEGFTFSWLINHRRLKPIGAFLTIVWLKEDPDEAKDEMRRGIK